ncbi:ribose ABC transporter permease [Desulfosporosinus sp. FKB]|uniref:ABC transporter permease n=1 Tax=Desulfosporosinus sp. FKB TaxID=1969835 RepID=UPI000B49CF82|nr:ribose ABC transporter permease [Desulfosporosinus sp. FKB]
MERIIKTIKRYHLGPTIGLFILIFILSFATAKFFTFGNLRNVALQISVNALIAVGMTFVILTAGIDLSVGSTLALSAALASQLMVGHVSPWLAVIAALAFGGLAGALNGFFVAYAGLAPFIVTLGTMTLFRGMTEIYTNGMPIFNLPQEFAKFGTGTFLEIPIPVWVMALVFITAWVVLHRTIAGRRIYAIGGNERVSFLAGVPVKRYLLSVYVVSGILASLAGIILASRLGSAEPTAGVGYELDAITAVVLGGTSLAGGEGTLVGTLIGALILGIIDNGLNLLNVNSFYQDAVKGLIILAAIMLDRKKSSAR